jgi:hypothetical protein
MEYRIDNWSLQMMKIVAFGHEQRTGKDTAAGFMFNILKAKHGSLRVCKIGFADAVKDTSLRLFGWTGLEAGIFYEKPGNGYLKDTPLEKYPQLTPRDIWIHVGESLRAICPEIWVRKAMECVHPDTQFLIFSDLRKLPEAQFIQSQGGFCFRMIRDSVQKSNDPVDRELREWSGWNENIYNNEGYKELYARILILTEEIIGGKVPT